MNLNERQKLFANPSKEYRGKPFWSWNGKLEQKELEYQIDVMKEMGFGGYFMHSRTGLETEYLGKEWFDLINSCADYGQERDMESWLYDEDRWPSGCAGGIVTREEKYRAMYMDMFFVSAEEWETYQKDSWSAGVFALTNFRDGIFETKRKIEAGDKLADNETVVEFRFSYHACSDGCNETTAADTMNKEAMEKFIELTHEKYQENCGDRIGKTILGIFTDEPTRGMIFSDYAGYIYRGAYTPRLFEEFEKRFGYSLQDNLPELYLRTGQGELSRVKRDYIEVCQELFLEAYSIPIDKWCREHNMIFTGHVVQEDSLSSQTLFLGSLMRFYEYQEYPGIDMLTENNWSYWMAKQIQSVARQLDKKKVLSELYGATGWNMDFEGYKNIGDWQALFGINFRCPHLSWYTMKGEAKRDWPASILHQSFWHHDFAYVEDYFSRIHVARDGEQSLCELLVLSPIESVWARCYGGCFKGLKSADPEITRLEEQYAGVFHALTDERIDFDYGDEDILARHGKVENGFLYVGKASYKKILVAGVDTMRSSTLALLQEFEKQGGEVIFSGEVPAYIDAVSNDAAKKLAESCVRIPFEKEAIAKACASGSEVKILSKQNVSVYAQANQIEGGRMVMLLNMDRDNDCRDLTIDLGKGFGLELWDPRSGKVIEPAYQVKDGSVIITIDLEKGGERLYLVTEQKRSLDLPEATQTAAALEVPDVFDYQLTERNICVLDMVSVRLENGTEVPCMEVLKADRALRDIWGLPYRGGGMLQPWYQIKYKGGNTELVSAVELKYALKVQTVPKKVWLVVEELAHIQEIYVNDTRIPLKSVGRWLDICFDELEISGTAFREGDNQITIVLDYYKTSGIEAVYLLGDFGVEVNGDKVQMTVLPQKLSVGDISVQGLPFYTGSVIYKTEGLEDKNLLVAVEQFGGSLVKLHGSCQEQKTVIAFPPYQAEINGLTGIEVVFNRKNTFGPFHEVHRGMSGLEASMIRSAFGDVPGYGKELREISPDCFTTTGESWTQDYRLAKQGLLAKPGIWEKWSAGPKETHET